MYKPKDISFPALVDGNVRTTGTSLTLGVGELAFVDISKTTKNGVKILADFAPLSPSSKLAIRMGEPNDYVSRSEDNKALSTIPFKLNDVKSIYVDAPQKAGVDVDDFVIGFNGKAGSEIDLANAENESFEITLSGNIMGMYGLPDNKFSFVVPIGAPIDGTKGTDWTMHEIVENAYIELKNRNIPGGGKITDLVDIMLVNSENPETLPGTETTFYNLVVVDEGMQSNLGSVQAQYPDLDVKRLKWESGSTTYSVIADALPDPYQPSSVFAIKGCDDCPAGYDELAQGLVYQVVIESPTDLTATVQGLPGATTSTAVRNEVVGDTSYYTVVTDDALTDAEIASFFTANAGTLAIDLIANDVVDLCQGPDADTIAWTEGETCNYTEETYIITLADNKCGESRLAELQAAFPDLTIVENGNSTRTVTLTGTSGTANVVVDGTNYLATFNAALGTTASDFVTSHAAAILAATGAVVTANAAVLTFAYPTEDAPTLAITNVSGNLAGTVGTQADAGVVTACQRSYSTTVNTNLVCEECDPIFRDVFESEAPDSFEGVSWEKEPKTYSANAKMGIRVRGKRSSLAGNEWFRDEMPFIDDSVEISLAGGYPNYTNESYLAGTNDRFTVKYFSRKSRAHNLGGNLRKHEEEGNVHFRGRSRYKGNNFAKYVTGQETRLDALGQYVVFSMTIAPHSYESSFQQPQNGAFTYHFPVAVGKHLSLESMLNKLAAAAGIPQIQATSK